MYLKYQIMYRQTRDEEHLELILNCVPIKPGMRILDLGTEASLQFIDGFETVIRFPRKRETAFGFDEIVSRHDKNVINGYKVEVTDDEIWITEKVNNLLYREGTK